MRRAGGIFALLVFLLGIFSCARPKPEEKTEKKPKAEYKEIKAEEYPVPEQLKELLPGLLNDKIRIWREIAKTINLVAYMKDYSLEKAIEKSAQVFLLLRQYPEFKKDIEFWIIQLQPEKGSEVLVWGVRPSEVEEYQASGDLRKFFAQSEYVLINDQIIEKGEERLKYFPEKPSPEKKSTK